MDISIANVYLVVAAIVQAIATVVLVVVTIVYVVLTRKISKASKDSADATKESAGATRQSADATKQAAIATEKSVEQMKDSVRPILVPLAGSALAGRYENLDSRLVQHVVIKNIGAGPALNGRCRLENGSQKDAKARWATDAIEARTYVRPLGVNEKDFMFVYYLDSPFRFEEWSWLTVSYDDVYGRHFETEAQWNGHDWITSSVKTVATPAPYFDPVLPEKLSAGL
jgi:hypothetical protein